MELEIGKYYKTYYKNKTQLGFKTQKIYFTVLKIATYDDGGKSYKTKEWEARSNWEPEKSGFSSDSILAKNSTFLTKQDIKELKLHRIK